MSRGAGISERERSRPASRYELLLKIASGATATVYVARRTDLERIVAVKRAHPHLLDDPAARRTLLDEARLASRIRHANVTSIHDVEETDDDLLLVMDYVEGASLAELLEAAGNQGGGLDAAVAVRIALDVAHGLAAVHELVGDDGRPLGMVHRDVSPQNVLVGLDGTSRVADFGLARLAPGRDVSRTTGAVQGKLAYVAPEVLTGARCTAKSELFALGVVVWEALTGKRLFRGENEGDTLRRVLAAEVPRLSQMVPALGPSLDAPLARALAREPAERQPSVRVFGSELEEAARRAGLFGTSSAVSATVEALVGGNLARRREILLATLSVANETGLEDPEHGVTASLNELPAAAHTALLFAPPRQAEPAPPEHTTRVLPVAPHPRPANEVVPAAAPVAPTPTRSEEAPTPAREGPAEPAQRPRWPLSAAHTIGLAAATLGLALGVGIGVFVARGEGAVAGAGARLAPMRDVTPSGLLAPILARPAAVPLDALPDAALDLDAPEEAEPIPLDALPDSPEAPRPARGATAPKSPVTAEGAGREPPPNPYKSRRP